MDNTNRADPSPGQCFYCNACQGNLHSLAFPFWSNQDDRVVVVIVPRCTYCYEQHQRRKQPDAVIMIGVVFAALMLAKLILILIGTVTDTMQTLTMAAALVIGALLGIVVASQLGVRRAAAAGTKPVSKFVAHPDYQSLNQDTEQWRNRYSAADTGSASRTETVADWRTAFQGKPVFATAAAALEQAIRTNGIQA